MADINEIKTIVAKLEQAEKILTSAEIPEQYRNDIQGILSKSAITPMEYDTIFQKQSASTLRRLKESIYEKITVPMSLEEQKQNVETLLSAITGIIMQLNEKLESMKGQGYFSPQEEITKTTTTYSGIYRAGQLGSMGVPITKPAELVYHKQAFTGVDIDGILQQLKAIYKEVGSLLINTKDIQLDNNVFAQDNIAQAKTIGIVYRNSVFDVYRTINKQFLPQELSDDYFEKTYKYMGKQYRHISKLITDKDVGLSETHKILHLPPQSTLGRHKSGMPTRAEYDVIKGHSVSYDIPEMETMAKISLADTKDIDNPEFPERMEELKALQSLVLQLADVLGKDGIPLKVGDLILEK